MHLYKRYQSVRDGRESVVDGVVVAVLLLLTETALTWTFVTVTGTIVQMLGLFVMLSTATVGRSARAGIVGGGIAVGAVVGSWFTGATIAVAGVVGVTVCTSLLRLPGELSARWIGHCIGVAVVTATSLAAASGLLAQSLGIAPFSLHLFWSFRTILPMTLIAVPVLGLLVHRPTRIATVSGDSSLRERLLVAGIVMLWAVGAYGISYLTRRMSLAEITGVDAIGSGGYLVATLGVIAVVALLFARTSEIDPSLRWYE